MLSKTFALALVSAILPLSLCAADIVPDPFPPAHFNSLYMENDDKGISTTIQATGDAVTYKVAKGPIVLETATVHPSADDWFNFIQALNRAKVYKWAPRYQYPGQGPSWVIDFVMDERTFYSEGTNDYPMEGAEAQSQADPKVGPSLPFMIFWQAALKLVGKAPPPTKP